MSNECALSGARAAIAAHDLARGFEIESNHHQLVMLLGDLLEWSDLEGVDIDLALEDAREMVADCR